MNLKLFILSFGLELLAAASIAQCTVNNGSGTWQTRTCAEGGSLTASFSGDVIIPSGAVVTSGANGQVLTNTGNITIQSGGELDVDDNNVDVFGNIVVDAGGTLTVNGKLNIGGDDMTGGCGYTLIVNGDLVVPGGTSDKLRICNEEIVRGGSAGCNDPPYCTGPTGGTISGPIAYDENGENPAILPIELLFFDAKTEGDNVLLTWATISEENFEYFSIQRSRDARDWQEISRVDGNGDSNERLDYFYVDENPPKGNSYYRLQSVDFDGYTEIFRAVAVFVTNSTDFNIYPSVVRGAVIGIAFESSSDAFPMVRIMDLSGRQYLQTTLSATGTLNIPQSISNGLYVLELVDRSVIHTARFIVDR